MDWNLVVTITGLLGAFIAFLLSTALWLSRQFSSVRNLVFDKHEQLKTFIVAKLEYHEKHDDDRFKQMSDRFTSVNNDVWALRVRNAASDAKVAKN